MGQKLVKKSNSSPIDQTSQIQVKRVQLIPIDLVTSQILEWSQTRPIDPSSSPLSQCVRSPLKTTKPNSYKTQNNFKTFHSPLFPSLISKTPRATPFPPHFSLISPPNSFHLITHIFLHFSSSFHPSYFSYLLRARRKLVGQDELIGAVSSEIPMRQARIHVLEVDNAQNLEFEVVP